MGDVVRITTEDKALKVNLEPKIYGCFAEIGAGQEVAANFFRAGGSSGTIGYTISAYDMKISDSMYGECGRYVSEERVTTMLNKEYAMLNEKLGHRADDTCFFSFANTLEALNYHKTNQGQGWVGIKFQLTPNSEPNECILHIKMHDTRNNWQQEAIGILGVNLIYACYFLHHDPQQLMLSLYDRLTRERIEIDMFRLSGPDFEDVDNRLMALRLVKNGMTDATMFGPEGQILQPSDSLYKKNILLLRGRFRPPTYVNMNMLKTGYDQFKEEHDVEESNIQVLFELTLKDLSPDGSIDEQDFLDRVELLGALGQTVMISNYLKFYKVVEYLSGFTRKFKIGVILGIYNLQTIFEKKYYGNLPGGILQAFGQGFGNNVKLYAYPAMKLNGQGVYSTENFDLPEKLVPLFEHMCDNNRLAGIEGANLELLEIYSDKVLSKIQQGEEDWEEMVPPIIAEIIKKSELFGYKKQLSST